MIRSVLMPVILKILAGDQSSVIEVPNQSHVTISESGEVTVELAQVGKDFETLAHERGGVSERTKISARTTGHEPPAVGERINLTVCIHEKDPTDPEVRPVARDLLLIAVEDPSPGLRKSRKVQFEIEEYRHLDSFTFHPS